MPKNIEIRADNVKFDLLFGNDIPEHYSDGIGQVMVGPVMSKLLFYSSAGVDENGVEERNIAFKISLPTNAMIELAKAIVANTIPNRDLLLAQFEVAKNGLAELTGSLELL